jgi:hypothetical protein
MIAPDRNAGLKILRGRHGAIFSAVMNAIIPRGGAFGPGAADYDLLPLADEIVKSYDPAIRKLFPLILDYVQFGAMLRKGRLFTGLDERKGMEFLGSMERSHFFYRRMFILLLKLVTMLAFYDRDETARFTGYEHDWCHLKKGQAS